MFTKIFIAGLVFMMASSVLFGIGAVTVLSIPLLNEQAPVLLPIVVGLSLGLAIPVAWLIAPRLRLRYWRSRALDESHSLEPMKGTVSPLPVR